MRAKKIKNDFTERAIRFHAEVVALEKKYRLEVYGQSSKDSMFGSVSFRLYDRAKGDCGRKESPSVFARSTTFAIPVEGE